MADPELVLVPLGITMMMLGLGGMIAIVKWASYAFDPRRHPQRQRLAAASEPKQEERLRALEVYRQLASEKLDAVKTAIAMGYGDKELELLDQRLENLIGSEALQSVIRGEVPQSQLEAARSVSSEELRMLKITR